MLFYKHTLHAHTHTHTHTHTDTLRPERGGFKVILDTFRTFLKIRLVNIEAANQIAGAWC